MGEWYRLRRRLRELHGRRGMLKQVRWLYVERKAQALHGLPAQREIGNFSCSHRRLLVGALVRGAPGVQAPARPVPS
jgi:hypothetical protein